MVCPWPGAEQKLLPTSGTVAGVGEGEVRALEQLTRSDDGCRRVANELEQVNVYSSSERRRSPRDEPRRAPVADVRMSAGTN